MCLLLRKGFEKEDFKATRLVWFGLSRVVEPGVNPCRVWDKKKIKENTAEITRGVFSSSQGWENPCGIFCSPKQCCGKETRSTWKMMLDAFKTAQRKKKKKLNSGGRELDPVCPITSWRGNEKSRVLLQKALGKTAEMESPHYCLCSSGWGAGGDRGNLGTGAGASTLTPPPAATPHRQVHFQPRWPVIQRLNITNEALNGTRGLS